MKDRQPDIYEEIVFVDVYNYIWYGYRTEYNTPYRGFGDEVDRYFREDEVIAWLYFVDLMKDYKECIMKWHRIKTEVDLPPMNERVLLHKYDGELRFEWVDIGSYQGLIRNDNGGYSYLWDIDFNNANDFTYTESDNLGMYDHWAEIEMPPMVVLDDMSEDEYVAHTAEMGGVGEAAEIGGLYR